MTDVKLMLIHYICAEDVHIMERKCTLIDLFCGAGGMSYGFELAGFQPVLAIDNWKDALDTYCYNNPDVPTVCADLSVVSPESISIEYGIRDVDLIIGGPPCQGFSVAGKRLVDDKRNELYKSFVEFVRFFSPKMFVMENVPNILSIGAGTVKNEIIRDFELLGYNVVYKVLTASDFGVPQNRKRAIFVGCKNAQYNFPVALVTDKVTASDAISDLPENSVVDGMDYTIAASTDYQKWARSKSKGVHNHETTAHNEKTRQIISMVPDGGNYKNLPLELRETRKVHIAWTRLNSEKPSITIDTGHRHHFHYLFNRIPTVRECARIQSFPDHYIFFKSKTSQYKQVGNAVPPLMAKAIAEEVIKVIKK